MTIEYLYGIERVLMLADFAIEEAILNCREFVFVDWQSRNKRGLDVS